MISLDEVERVAAANRKAGDWVTTIPSPDIITIGPEAGKAFDPRQPRDERGQWSEVPGLLGHSVTEHMTLPKTGKIKAAVEHASKQIEKVLDLPELPPVTVTSIGAGKGYGGSYRRQKIDPTDPDSDIVPEQIRLTTARPELSFLHEFGHMLDNTAISPDFNDFESTMAATHDRLAEDPETKVPKWYREPDPRVLAVEHAMQNTEAMARLHFANVYDYAMNSYLMRPAERFARAFMQYIVMRSGDPKLRRAFEKDTSLDLAIERAVDEDWREARRWNDNQAQYRARKTAWYREDPNRVPDCYRFRQWSEKDFEPIARALDDLFKERGWLKTTSA